MATRTAYTTDLLASWLVTKPKTVGAVLFGLLLVSALILPSMRVDSGTSSFIPDGDPARTIQREVEKQFIGEDLLVIGLQTDDVFSHRALTEQRGLDQALRALVMAQPDGGTLALVEDVMSLTTIKTVDGADMSYRNVPLVPDEIPTSPEALQKLRARALTNPLIAKSMLSTSSPGAAGVLIRLTKGLNDDQFAFVTERVRALINEEHTTGPTRYYLAGDPVVTVDTATYQQADLETFVPVTYLLLVVAMFLYLRRGWGVAIAVINASVSLVAGMATVALLASLTNLSSIMPPLLMVLSVATVVHFTTEYLERSKTSSPRDAARRTIADLLVPTFMCEATTAVGMASFCTSNIPALREFGLSAAVAIMVSFASSFLVLGLAARFLPAERLLSPTPSVLSSAIDRGIGQITELAIRSPRRMLAAVVVVSVLLGVGMTRLRVNHDDVEQFAEDMPLQQATRFLQARLGGSGELVVSIKSPTADRFLEPAELQRIEALQAFLEKDFGATATASFADYVKLMHRGFNGDAPDAYRLPDSHDQVAQLVFLNGDDRLFQYVDRSYRWVRIEARTPETGSEELTRRFARLDTFLQTQFPKSEGYEAQVSGSTLLAVVLGNRILDSQTSSFGLSLLLIFVPIALLFGSFVAGAFTVPSNLFPILACLGTMGWLGIALDISSTMIASIILGIAVDDTIHFVQSIRKLLGEGESMEQALRHTMGTKGVGALWITLIISMGFVALLGSRFRPTAEFGLLTAFGMGTGAIAELCLLPPLLLVTGTRLGVPRRPS